MGRRKKIEATIAPTKFARESSIIVDGFEILRGEIIKIKDEYGCKFKFDYLVTNTETGSQWIDCFEIIGHTASVYRSFSLDRVKRIPKRGKRAKRVV